MKYLMYFTFLSKENFKGIEESFKWLENTGDFEIK